MAYDPWAAVLATADVGVGVSSSSAAVLMVGGVAIGSLTWGSLLASGVTAAGHALGSRAIRLADAIAGLGVLAFGGLLALRVAREDSRQPAESSNGPAAT